MRASSGDLAAAMPVAIEMVEMPYPLNLPPMPLRAAYNHDNGGMRLVIDQGDDGGILDTQTQVHHVLDAPSQAASHIHTDDGDIDNEPGVIAPSLLATAALQAVSGCIGRIAIMMMPGRHRHGTMITMVTLI